MIKPFAIRDLNVNPGLVLAPMSGVTCSAFRRLIKELNPGAVGYVISEFVSIEGMTRGGKRTLEMMKFRPEERPYGIQIFGYDIDRMRDAAVIVEEFGADIVDINCGCPAPKVVKRGGGAELMRQPDHLREIFKAVRSAVSIPVTMKMRSGWDQESQNCVEIAKIAEGEGLEAVTVHGRTRAQLYRGMAEWQHVQEVKKAVSSPVCGSGDVVDQASAHERLSGGADGLYIGRGALANPFVFSEICGDKAPHALRTDALLMLSVLERYRELLSEDMPDHAMVGRIKQLASQAARGHGWRKRILRAMNSEELHREMAEIREGVLNGTLARDGSSQVIEAPESIDSCDAFTAP